MAALAKKYNETFLEMEERIEKTAVKGWCDPFVNTHCYEPFLELAFKKYLGAIVND